MDIIIDSSLSYSFKSNSHLLVATLSLKCLLTGFPSYTQCPCHLAPMNLSSRPDFLPPVLLLQSTLETAASDHAKICIWRKVCNAPHASLVYQINKRIPFLSLVWPWFLLQGHFSLIPLLDLTLNSCWVTRKPLNLPSSFMSRAFDFKDFSV